MHRSSLHVKGLCEAVGLALGILASAAAATANVCLDDGAVYSATGEPGGSPPFSVLACDVNGDNNANLIRANDGDDTISVLINNGDGTFASAARVVAGKNSEVTIEGVAVACCDVDGDELVDLITVNHTSDDISLLFNKGLVEGTPQFVAPIHYPVGEAPCPDAADADCGGREARCSNGVDDNCDGLLVCDDPGCACGDLDSDGDSDVDLLDIVAFQVCFGAAPASLQCAVMDSNADEQIDPTDLAKLVRLQTGPQ